MKIAVTIWKERVSPLFDAARTLLIADVAGRAVVARRLYPLQPEPPHRRAARLAEMGVNTLICGAISRPQATLLEAYGIRVLADVTGRAETALASFLNDRLSMHIHVDNQHQPGNNT